MTVASVTVVIGASTASLVSAAATTTVQSVQVSATSDTGSVTQAVSNCTSTCALNVPVATGRVRFDGTLYSGRNASGTALATASATATMVAGQANHINLVFASTGAVPSPTATSQPVAGGSATTGVYAQLFSASSPLRTTVAQHKAAGATVLSASALWSQGLGSQDLSPSTYMFPVYVSSSNDPVKTISCAGYGRCNAHGAQIHIPSGAKPEPHADGHIAVIDTAQSIEFDGYQCSIGSSTLSCTWGGKYTLGGYGITNSSSDAVHAGYAAGIMDITGQELLNGHIDHALALDAACLNEPTVYPADTKAGGTDRSCGGYGSPSYGQVLHLTLSASQIAATNHSAECKTVLTALATYGAYTYDTGSTGLSLITESTLSYSALGKTSPWTTTILPHLQAAGEANGTYWNSCLSGLSASNFELVQIPAGSY
jgi:ribonuclease HI